MLNLVGAESTVSWSDLTSVFSAITGQFTIPNVIGVLAGAMGIAITFVFMWFGVKKGLAIVKNAINSGRMSSGAGGRRR